MSNTIDVYRGDAKATREEQAAHELGNTEFAPGTRVALVVVFLTVNELKRGQDRLAGKKLVIWEFAARELACGDRKLLPMTLGEKRDVGRYLPADGETVEIRGVVRAASPAPRPGSGPYKDHIIMVHLAEIESTDDPSAVGKEAVVFVWSMRDNVATPASRYRPGDAVRLRLRPWDEVTDKYEAINRSELDDDEILLAKPAWGL